MRKTIVFLAVLCALALLSSCAGDSPRTAVTTPPSVEPTVMATPTPTPSPAPAPTPTPAPTPKPVPAVLEALEQYYTAHQEEESYHISKPAEAGYGIGEYKLELVYDEVPSSNGTAIVVAKDGRSSFEINFSYSTFMGNKLCSPQLIRSVVVSTVHALEQLQGLEESEDRLSAVIASYDDQQYSSVTMIGEYACVFKPADVYASTVSVVFMEEYVNPFAEGECSEGSHSQMQLKLNEGTKYRFNGIVQKNISGQYTNSFATYKCKLLSVELEDGNTIQIAYYPDQVPVQFEIGQQYEFYGTTMFDKNGDMLFYLRFAK